MERGDFDGIGASAPDVTEQYQDYSDADWSNRLLNAIIEIQTGFIEESDIRQSFSRMLDSLLELTASEYGFLGEVLYGDDNQPYLVTHALTDISWNEDTRSSTMRTWPRASSSTT